MPKPVNLPTPRMLYAIPALPVSKLNQSVEFYRDMLGFALIHREAKLAVLRREAVELHLWVVTDEDWRARDGIPPVVSGAESFLAGTASCRLAVEHVEELHGQLEPLGIVHPNAPLRDLAWGSREFGVLDPDNNLVSFFENK